MSLSNKILIVLAVGFVIYLIYRKAQSTKPKRGKSEIKKQVTEAEQSPSNKANRNG